MARAVPEGWGMPGVAVVAVAGGIEGLLGGESDEMEWK